MGTSWVVVKYLPLYFAKWKFESEITYLVYHLMQYVVLWALYTLHSLHGTRTEQRSETRMDAKSISRMKIPFAGRERLLSLFSCNSVPYRACTDIRDRVHL